MATENRHGKLTLLALALLTATGGATAELTPPHYFPWEKEVITNATLAPGYSQYEKYFAFPNSSFGAEQPSNRSCKVFPGDAAWPSPDLWASFNKTLGDRLIQTVPLAHDCYNSAWGEYDAQQCEYVAANWNDSYLHTNDPTSVAWPLFQGRTCLPDGQNVTDTCTLGGSPSYVVNASTSADIQLAINFARNTNIRLVVKNTGHDFGGRSTGAGALSIWTHNLKDLHLIPTYTTPSYTGPAIHLAAGVQVHELYSFADAHNLTAIGGECDTVGVAGGYLLGGGHSPLSSLYGLASDHVLALTHILPNGTLLTATETHHPSLFWALRGGGGATFGTTVSITVRAHAPLPLITTSTFEFATTPTLSAEVFWEAVRAYFDYFLAFPEAGAYAYWWVIPLGNAQFSFQMRPFFAPGLSAAQTTALLGPWLDRVRALGFEVTPNTTEHRSFLDAWRAGFAREAVGMSDSRSGSRLFPRGSFADEGARNATFAALRETTEKGAVLLAFNMRAEEVVRGAAGAANPHWRDAAVHACVGVGVGEGEEGFGRLTNEVLGRWREVNPSGGAYANEADLLEPGWQEAFWGGNYERLAEVKGEVDPWGVFWAETAVGSEGWEVRTVDGLATQDGRLCRVG